MINFILFLFITFCQIVVITGANCGIGLETARAVAEMGALVVMGCRDERKASLAIADIQKTVPRGQLVRPR